MKIGQDIKNSSEKSVGNVRDDGEVTMAHADASVVESLEQRSKPPLIPLSEIALTGIFFTTDPVTNYEQARAADHEQYARFFHDLLAHATAKRARKGVPLLVGNIGPATFGQDDNALLLVDAQGAKELPHNSKLVLARQLVAEIAKRQRVTH